MLLQSEFELLQSFVAPITSNGRPQLGVRVRLMPVLMFISYFSRSVGVCDEPLLQIISAMPSEIIHMGFEGCHLYPEQRSVSWELCASLSAVSVDSLRLIPGATPGHESSSA